MKLKFTKMHGTGNDYVYVNCFEQKIDNPNELAIKVSDRHFGIGSDGLILICPSEAADVRMAMYNADGSEGMMCGNGIRCVAKYSYEHGLVDSDKITVETKSGIKTLDLTVENGEVTYVAVDMGMAILKPREIPVDDDGDDFVKRKIDVDGKEYEITCVSMGNPHAVIFTKDIDNINLEKIGPLFEHHKLFPEQINTEFVEVTDSHNIKMRVWERGSGETMSCGTGTCAVTVAAVLNGYCKCDEGININIRGGQLKDTYLSDGRVIMRGTATNVFDGEIEI